MAVQEMEREVQVLGVFRQILDAPALGPEQNFFEAGGSSLLAARLAARLRTTGILDVPTSAIFAAPTARTLTRYAQSSTASMAPRATHSTGSHPMQTPVPERTTEAATAQPVVEQANVQANIYEAIDRGARQRAAFARLRPAPVRDAEEVR